MSGESDWSPFPVLFENFSAEWTPKLGFAPGTPEWGEFRDDVAELCATAIDCAQGAFRRLMGLG